MQTVTNGDIRYALKFIDPLTGILETTFTELSTSDTGTIEVTPELAPVLESDAIWGTKRNRQRNTHKGEEKLNFVMKCDISSQVYEKLWTIHNLGEGSFDLENGLEFKELHPFAATVGQSTEKFWSRVSIAITQWGGGDASASEQIAFSILIDACDPEMTEVDPVGWPGIPTP